MTAKVFLDTNILLYAVSAKPEESPKREVAKSLLERDDIGLSVQVLQEFYVNATQKIATPIPHDLAIKFIVGFTRYPVASITIGLMAEALEIKTRYQISYWDAAIIAAAQELRCTTLCTEDLNPDQQFGNLQVLNPFAPKKS